MTTVVLIRQTTAALIQQVLTDYDHGKRQLSPREWSACVTAVAMYKQERPVPTEIYTIALNLLPDETPPPA